MKKALKTVMAAVSLSVCAALLGACGLQEPAGSSSANAAPAASGNQAAPAPSAATGAAASNKAIGTASNGETVQRVSLMNLTGQDITGFVVKHSFEDAFGENMVPDGETFALDEVRDLYYDEAPAIEAGKNAGDALTYDVLVTLANGKSGVLHQFPFHEFEQGRILLQDGVLFLEYVSPYTGEDIVTRSTETAFKEQAEKQAKERAEKKAAKAAEKAAQQAAEQAAAEQQWAAEQAMQQQWAAEQAAQQQWAGGGQDQGAGCVGGGALVY